MLGPFKSAGMQQTVTEEKASSTENDAHNLYDTIRESIPQGNKLVPEEIAGHHISSTGISVLG